MRVESTSGSLSEAGVLGVRKTGSNLVKLEGPSKRVRHYEQGRSSRRQIDEVLIGVADRKEWERLVGDGT
jgi:hypothetical protein